LALASKWSGLGLGLGLEHAVLEPIPEPRAPKYVNPPLVTLSPCCRERRQSLSLQSPEMWRPNLPDLNPVDYSIWGYASRQGLPFADP